MPFLRGLSEAFSARRFWGFWGWAFRPYWGRSLCSLAGVRWMLISLYRPLIPQFLKNFSLLSFCASKLLITPQNRKSRIFQGSKNQLFTNFTISGVYNTVENIRKKNKI